MGYRTSNGSLNSDLSKYINTRSEHKNITETSKMSNNKPYEQKDANLEFINHIQAEGLEYSIIEVARIPGIALKSCRIVIY